MRSLVLSQPKKKKKPKAQSEAPADAAAAEAAPDAECQEPLNGFHANGSAAVDGDSLDSLSEQLDSASLDAVELDSETAPPEEATGVFSELRWCLQALSSDWGLTPPFFPLPQVEVCRPHQAPPLSPAPITERDSTITEPVTRLKPGLFPAPTIPLYPLRPTTRSEVRLPERSVRGSSSCDLFTFYFIVNVLVYQNSNKVQILKL